MNPSKEIFEILNEIQTKGDEGNMNIFTLTEVIIPEGMTSIGNDWFNRCSSLTNVQLPSTLRSIGEHSFINTGLKTITIPRRCKVNENSFDSECKIIEDNN